MELLTVQPDGSIPLPAAVRERLGIRPGAKVALEEGCEGGCLQLRVLPEEASLVEEEGVWIIRAACQQAEDEQADWVARVREERDAALLGRP